MQVDEKVCEERHKSVDKHLAVVDKRLDSHSGEIKDINEVLIRLTHIMEQLTTPKSFWQSETGKKVIGYVFIITAVVVLAAIGLKDLVPTILGGK
jgi:hypothetical protein